MDSIFIANLTNDIIARLLWAAGHPYDYFNSG